MVNGLLKLGLCIGVGYGARHGLCSEKKEKIKTLFQLMNSEKNVENLQLVGSRSKSEVKNKIMVERRLVEGHPGFLLLVTGRY